MITAGIAATRPIAVASSASAMPGATTARFVVCDFEMPMKLFMMPQTVPKRPTKGEVAPIVARRPMPMRMRRASARTISEKLDAARSLMPLSLEIPADSRPSRIAAAMNDDSTLPLAPSANCASASERDSLILASAPRSLLCTTVSSIILAMNTVQVTSDAKARPIITAFTTMSAFRNIFQGDNSCSPVLVDFTSLPSPAAGAVGASIAAGVGAAAAGAGAACGAAADGWAAG
jgi:hypothetical protein